MLVRVPGSARPPASVDGSVRLWATLLPAAALAMGALAPATRLGRFTIRGLAAVTFAWGTLIAVLGARLIRKAGLMERAEQPRPALITREDPSGTVAAMRRGSQADQEQPRATVAESGQRPRPVRLAAIPAWRLRRRGFTMEDEPWTAATAYDRRAELPERPTRRWFQDGGPEL